MNGKKTPVILFIVAALAVCVQGAEIRKLRKSSVVEPEPLYAKQKDDNKKGGKKNDNEADNNHRLNWWDQWRRKFDNNQGIDNTNKQDEKKKGKDDKKQGGEKNDNEADDNNTLNWWDQWKKKFDNHGDDNNKNKKDEKKKGFL